MYRIYLGFFIEFLKNDFQFFLLFFLIQNTFLDFTFKFMPKYGTPFFGDLKMVAKADPFMVLFTLRDGTKLHGATSGNVLCL